ncbi:universal stress protein [Lutibacter sp.]|uniref:universal stress protein n=1 Tax=Lutibacter sp. TaxID=1925666 RepID=UPI00356993F3
MKNVLILTNFSTNSWNSIKYALSLFKNKRCNFYLLNTTKIIENVAINNQTFVQNKKEKDPKTAFDKLMEKISSSPLKGKHVFIPIITDTEIIAATKLQVEEKNIDLIVMRTDGKPFFGNMKENSIFENVITKVKCSILVVPNDTRFRKINEVAFPTDYTNFNEANLLQNITDLLRANQSKLRFVHLAKKDEVLDKEQLWNKETLQDYFKDQSDSFHVEINKNFEVSIENFIDKMGIDLIIMAAKNLNLLEEILFRPRINNVKYYSKTPFLILHQSIN